MEKTVRTAMRDESGPDDDVASGELSNAGGKISFLVREQAQLDEARERLFSETQGAGLTGQRDWNIDVIDTTRIVLTPTNAGQAQAAANAMDTARDTLDKRDRKREGEGKGVAVRLEWGGRRIIKKKKKK